MDYRIFTVDPDQESAPVLQPRLLLLSAFLTSALLWPANLRVLGAAAPVSGMASCLQVSMAIAAGVIAAILLYRNRRDAAWSLIPPTSAPVAIAAYAVVQFVTDVLLVLGIGPLPLYCLLGIANAILIGPVIIWWTILYSEDFQTIMFHGAISCLISCLLGWLLSFCTGWLLLVAEALMLIAGTAPLLLGSKEIAERECIVSEQAGGAEQPPKGKALLSNIGKLISLLGIPLLGLMLSIAISASYVFTSAGHSIQTEFIGTLIGGAVVVLICLIRRRHPLAFSIEYLAIPICIAASLVFGSLESDNPLFVVGAPLVFVPMTMMALFALSSLVRIAAAGEFPLRFVFGSAFCLACLAVLIGFAIQQTIGQSMEIGPAIWTTVSIYYAAVLINLGWQLWRQSTGHDLYPDTSKAVEDESEASNEDEGEPGSADYERIHEALVNRTAQEHGLTRRETEILSYLTLGYSSTRISKTLFISDNTVRTHMKNIYRKTGVGSREELMYLVGNQLRSDEHGA